MLCCLTFSCTLETMYLHNYLIWFYAYIHMYGTHTHSEHLPSASSVQDWGLWDIIFYFVLITTPWCNWYDYHHFTDAATEAWRISIIWPQVTPLVSAAPVGLVRPHGDRGPANNQHQSPRHVNEAILNPHQPPPPADCPGEPRRGGKTTTQPTESRES